VLDSLEGHAATEETVLLAGDLNAQPHYGRLDGWYDRSLTAPANDGNTGFYRELDDADPRCPGYGEATALGPSGDLPPCGGGAKVDHVFVRSDRIAGPYSADALAIPHQCDGVPESPGVRAAGACSDHHVLLGTVTVRVRR
jgi:endonuclease/exonuclease/phosphatase family metal-dependent hydrolase